MRAMWLIAAFAACGKPTVQDTLIAERDRGDVAAIRAHGWELWSRLAASDPPEWDRWATTERMFAGASASARPRFRTPRPFRNGDAIDSETLPAMFDVVFDPHAEAHVRAHQLGKRAELARLHELPAFPRDAIAIKLVWYPVHATGLTAMPIWDGEPANPDGNPDRSWHRAVAVDPTRAVVPDGETAAITLDHRAFAAHVVPLAAFIHRALATDDEVATARVASRDTTLARGDEVALVAAHITTKEIPEWTWETYWWHDRAGDGAYAAGRPAITGPAANYLMDTTFGSDAPCFNPWLEARFPDGTHSNCVTCHQRAVVGAADYLPVTRGHLRADDPYLAGRVPTDFVWSLVFETR